jgi:hypothetical protein
MHNLNLYDTIKVDDHNINRENYSMKNKLSGWVEIYDSKDNLIHSDHNLIVYNGRINLSNLLFDNNNLRVRGLSLGTGGFVTSEDNIYRKIAVDPTDISLNNEISWNESNNGNYIETDTNLFGIKKFIKDETVTINDSFDPNNENQPLIKKIIVPVTSEECNSNENVNLISEAGLWLMDDNYTNESKQLFAKTIFDPISKTSSVSFNIIWYLFF